MLSSSSQSQSRWRAVALFMMIPLTLVALMTFLVPCSPSPPSSSSAAMSVAATATRPSKKKQKDLFHLMPDAPPLSAFKEPEQRTQIPPFTRRKESEKPRFAVLTLSSKTMRQTPARAGIKTDNFYEEIRRMSFSNKLSYCERHGYDLIVEDESVGVRNGNIMFSKFLAVQKWLPHYDWIVWLDHDALIVNMSAKIEDVVDKRIPFLEQQLRLANSTSKRGLKVRRHLLIKKHYRAERNIDNLNLGRFEQQQQQQQHKQIHLYAMADALGGLNSGVFFIRNSSWSLDFVSRVANAPTAKSDQEVLYKMLDISRQRYAFETNTTQVRWDRWHSWIEEDNAWNAYWIGMGLINPFLPGIFNEWLYSDVMEDLAKRNETSASSENITTELSATTFQSKLPFWTQPTKWTAQQQQQQQQQQQSHAFPASVVVHFVGCKAFPQCLPWMRYTARKANAMNAASELTRDVGIPFRYVPRVYVCGYL